MKRILTFVFLSLLTLTMVYGQGMSDTQILQFIMKEKKAGTADKDIATKLLKEGATIDQIQQLRQKYSKLLENKSLGGVADKAINDATNRMRVNNGPLREADFDKRQSQRVPSEMLYGDTYPLMADSLMVQEGTTGKKVFGRDIFNNKSLTFEPVMNIATPQNYVLGPGDQLIIDVYGATQESMSLTVSPDGDITIPDFGPIHVSGLTVSAAQNRIRSKLGSYYESSNIKASLGQTRTILVNVMGEVKAPGTYTVSAFATVFHALYMAGGVSDLGTLRNIKVFRQGKLISTVDIYEFILNGRLAGNVRLADNDVVQVGTYDCIVDITGRVKRPMAYEMRKAESLSTLLNYCGGFAGDAYKKSLRVLRKSGRMKSVYNVEEFELSDFKMADCDSVIVDSIIDRFENMVEVKGAIFRPGMYRLGEKVNSVRSLIENADGLTEEAMVTRAVVRRMKANRTQEVISIDLEGIMNGSAADVPLENEDILFIPTLAEHQNLRTLTIDGEVIFPGTYEYAAGMTIEDLILQAGGLTDAASTVKVDISRKIVNPEALDADMELAKTYSFPLKKGFAADGDLSFTLEPYDIVQVRKSPVYQDPICVYVEGEVAFEGKYTMEQKNQRLSDVIKAAGGVIPGGYVRGARLIRVMSDDERARMQAVIRLARQSATGKDSINLEQLALEKTYSVGIHLDEALANPGSTQDIELMDGDRLVVPRFNHTVRISGSVNAPNTVAYAEGEKYKYYIHQAGGFAEHSKKSHAFIVYQNGTIAIAKKGKVEPGCEIVVPTKAPRDTRTLQQWLSVATTAASLGTMAASIANLIKK